MSNPPSAGQRRRTRTLLKRGERFLEPDVYLTQLQDQPAVIKDYTRYRLTPLAPLARILVRREARMLRRLRAWRHSPKLVGQRRSLSLAMEVIPGQPLGSDGPIDDTTFRRLRGVVAQLHANGITHNDLHPSNVMVDGDRVVLLDFASALRTPRWLRRAPVLRELRRSDLASAFRMQKRLTGEGPGAYAASALANPAWVTRVRDGWKHFYRRVRVQAA